MKYYILHRGSYFGMGSNVDEYLLNEDEVHAMWTEEEIRDKLSKTGEEAFDFSDIRVDLEGEPFVPMKRPLLGLLIAGLLREGLFHVTVELDHLDTMVLQQPQSFWAR